MFKHILIPTDGSALSNTAVTGGVKLAQQLGSRITGLTVTPPFHVLAVETIQDLDSPEQYSANAQAKAARNLEALTTAALAAGVACDLVHCVSEHPYEAIVNTAQQRGCDVIFLASHGRRGMGALIIGSETNKVLTHTKIPVLVFR